MNRKNRARLCATSIASTRYICCGNKSGTKVSNLGQRHCTTIDYYRLDKDNVKTVMSALDQVTLRVYVVHLRRDARKAHVRC
jgi:hypothetical protein